MTRAVMHFMHLEFREAWHFNKLVVLVIPFLAYLWFSEIERCVKILKTMNHSNME